MLHLSLIMLSSDIYIRAITVCGKYRQEQDLQEVRECGIYCVKTALLLNLFDLGSSARAARCLSCMSHLDIHQYFYRLGKNPAIIYPC